MWLIPFEFYCAWNIYDFVNKRCLLSSVHTRCFLPRNFIKDCSNFPFVILLELFCQLDKSLLHLLQKSAINGSFAQICFWEASGWNILVRDTLVILFKSAGYSKCLCRRLWTVIDVEWHVLDTESIILGHIFPRNSSIPCIWCHTSKQFTETL